MAVFAHLEFRRPLTETEPVGFFGRRPSGPVLVFFVLFAMTNLAKGLIFGTLMVAIPIAGYLAWNRDLRAIRRYVWLWGWLAFVLVAAAWPVAVYPPIRTWWSCGCRTTSAG